MNTRYPSVRFKAFILLLHICSWIYSDTECPGADARMLAQAPASANGIPCCDCPNSYDGYHLCGIEDVCCCNDLKLNSDNDYVCPSYCDPSCGAPPPSEYLPCCECSTLGGVCGIDVTCCCQYDILDKVIDGSGETNCADQWLCDPSCVGPSPAPVQSPTPAPFTPTPVPVPLLMPSPAPSPVQTCLCSDGTNGCDLYSTVCPYSNGTCACGDCSNAAAPNCFTESPSFGPTPVPVSSPVPMPAPMPVAPTPSPVPIPMPTPVPVLAPIPSPTPVPVPAPIPSPAPVAVPAPIPSPVPIPKPFTPSLPSPVPIPTPTPVLVPASISSPAPIPTPSPPPASSPPSGGGTSCIASHQIVRTRLVHGVYECAKKIMDLKNGEEVLTDKGYRRYIGNIHESKVHNTVIIHTSENRTVELTSDHLIKTDSGFLHASDIQIGNILVGAGLDNMYVTSIRYGVSHVMSPLTTAGTIVVNDVVLSCYAVVRYHSIANFVYIPVRFGIVKSSSLKSYTMKIASVYNFLPLWFKSYTRIATLPLILV